MNQQAILDFDTIVLKAGAAPQKVAVTGSGVICKESNGVFELSANGGRTWFPLEVGLTFLNWAVANGQKYLETFTSLMFRNRGTSDVTVGYYSGSADSIIDARLNTTIYRQTVPVQLAPVMGPLGYNVLMHPGDHQDLMGIFQPPVAVGAPPTYRRRQAIITNLGTTNLTVYNQGDPVTHSGAVPFATVFPKTTLPIEGECWLRLQNDSAQDIQVQAGEIMYASPQ